MTSTNDQEVAARERVEDARERLQVANAKACVQRLRDEYAPFPDDVKLELIAIFAAGAAEEELGEAS